MKNSKAKALTAVSAMAMLAMMSTPAMATEPDPAPTADPAVAVPAEGVNTNEDSAVQPAPETDAGVPGGTDTEEAGTAETGEAGTGVEQPEADPGTGANAPGGTEVAPGTGDGQPAGPGAENEATAEQPLAFNLPYFKIFKEGSTVTLTDVVLRNTPEEQAKWDENNCRLGLATGNEGGGSYFVDARIVCDSKEEGSNFVKASLKDSGGYKAINNNVVSFSIPNFANFAEGETVIEFNEATGKVVVLEPKEKPVTPKDESGATNNGGNAPAPAPAPTVDKTNAPGKADVKAPVAVKAKGTVVTETPQASGEKKLAETGISATLLAMASVLGIGGTGLVGFSRRRK